MVDLPETIPLKKKKRHSYNLPIANSFSVRHGTSSLPLLSILRFGLVLACMGIIHTVINPIALYVQLPCHAQKTFMSLYTAATSDSYNLFVP